MPSGDQAGRSSVMLGVPPPSRTLVPVATLWIQMSWSAAPLWTATAIFRPLGDQFGCRCWPGRFVRASPAVNRVADAGEDEEVGAGVVVRAPADAADEGDAPVLAREHGQGRSREEQQEGRCDRTDSPKLDPP